MVAINFQLSGKTDALCGRGVPDTSSNTGFGLEQITGCNPELVWVSHELTQLTQESKCYFIRSRGKDKQRCIRLN